MHAPHKYLLPAIYTFIWAFGLCNSVFGFLRPTASEASRQITVAFSVYGIFFLNTLVELIHGFMYASTRHTKPMFAHRLTIFFICSGVAIMLAGFYSRQLNIGLLIGVVISMIVANASLGVFRHNPQLCVEEIKGRKFNTNLK